jgi:hypothetical protein
MTCRDVREVLDALLDGELEAAEESEVRVHLEFCAACGRELEELRDWQRTLTGALRSEAPKSTAAERRRMVDVLASSTRRRIPPSRLAALLAIGISVGVVTAAVGVSRPPEAQVARVVERVKEFASRDAQLRAVSAEIEQDLGEARQAVAGRGAEDPTARAVAVASENIARRLDGRPEPGLPAADAERVSVARTLHGETVSVVQMQDGRVRVETPAGRVQARSMADLLSRHADVCRRYAIGGSDGSITVGDSFAGADWKGRLDLLTRTGAWDESLQWEAYRGWLAPRVRDAKEIERKVTELQARCRASGETRMSVAAAADSEAILKDLKMLTRSELRRTQEKIEAEMKKQEDRLKEAAELRAHAKGLRIFAEDVGRD